MSVVRLLNLASHSEAGVPISNCGAHQTAVGELQMSAELLAVVFAQILGQKLQEGR